MPATERMPTPEPGDRFYDRDGRQDVTYLGDTGVGPWWRAADGHAFYCDWLDYYLWKRFERRA